MYNKIDQICLRISSKEMSKVIYTDACLRFFPTVWRRIILRCVPRGDPAAILGSQSYDDLDVMTFSLHGLNLQLFQLQYIFCFCNSMACESVSWMYLYTGIQFIFLMKL